LNPKQQEKNIPVRILQRTLRALLASPPGQALHNFRNQRSARDSHHWFDVTRLEFHLPRLPEVFSGIRLVQISDFHIGTWLTAGHLNQVIDQVNRLKPDLVVITGDFVTYRAERFTDILTSAFSRLTPGIASLGIRGNHDHWTDPGLISRMLKQAGIIELDNAVYTLERNGARLHIAGIDDYMNGNACLEKVLDALPAGESAVLLAHEPDFADIAAKTGRFDLQLSGHSHGGQMVLPFIGVPFLPQFARKYPRGFYKVNEMLLYTNRGLGTAEVALRINCRPEISDITLLPPSHEKLP
jgi:uncharacterized protein